MSRNKIVVNIEEPACRMAYFLPAGRELRPTIRPERLKNQTIDPIINAVGEIPGETITLDATERKATIYDRWGEKQYKARRDEFKARVKTSERLLDKAVLGEPREPEEYQLHTDDDVATWLFWVNRLVESKIGVLVEGTLPKFDEIRKIGNIRKAPQAAALSSPSVYIIPKEVEAKPDGKPARQLATAGA